MRSVVIACAVLACALGLSAADACMDAGSCGSSEETLETSSMLQLKDIRRAASAGSGSHISPTPQITELAASDFHGGTVRIRNPGTYRFTEDIEFDPQLPGMSWCKIPPDTEQYPQTGGYFLGFFAALTVEADDVELDCQGHEIRMSESFHKMQRFFALVELGSSPYPKGQGPPQFASSLTTVNSHVSANNVSIINCKFGLTSHHSLHGNENTGVNLRNLEMKDFEVAGLALNGASNVHAEKLLIGPSLHKTFRAALSQAIFIDHLASTLMEQDKLMKFLKRTRSVTLRGSTTTVDAIFKKLRTDLQTYMSGGGGPLEQVAGKGDELPDGSAIYGLLLHRSGVAINKLGFCPDESAIATKRVGNVLLKDIHIHDLTVRPDQAVTTSVGGRRVMGPAGDVVPVTSVWDPEDCNRYTGNPFTDAQIALGKVCSGLRDNGVPQEKISFYCGGSYVPTKVRGWASGKWTCDKSRKWASRLRNGTTRVGRFVCTGDSMNHFNKGAIGMRLGFQEDITVENVVIENIVNKGVPNAAPWCNITGGPYEGVDARAVSLAHMKDLHKLDVEQRGVLSSTDSSRVFPVTGMLQMRADDARAAAAS